MDFWKRLFPIEMNQGTFSIRPCFERVFLSSAAETRQSRTGAAAAVAAAALTNAFITPPFYLSSIDPSPS